MLSSVFFFFFSRRRRHTRLVSDWSSDVCSSDLYANAAELQADLDEVEQKQRPTTTMGMAPMGTWQREALKRSEEHTSELQSLTNLVCRLLLEKKKTKNKKNQSETTKQEDDQTKK